MVALVGALGTAFVAWSSAAFAAWTTALPSTVQRTLTLEQAREQYARGRSIHELALSAATVLAIAFAYLARRRAKLKFAASKRVDDR